MDKEKALCQALDAPDEDKALLRINDLKAAQKELNDIAAALNCEAKAERAEEKAENAVNAAIRDGRLPPVLKENAKEICKKWAKRR